MMGTAAPVNRGGRYCDKTTGSLPREPESRPLPLAFLAMFCQKDALIGGLPLQFGKLQCACRTVGGTFRLA